MEGIVIILIAIGFVVFVMPIMAMATAKRAERTAEEAHEKIRALEEKLYRLKNQAAEQTPQERPPVPLAPTILPERKPPPAPAPPPLPAWEEEDRRQIRGNAIPEERVFKSEPAEPPNPTAFSFEQFLGAKLFAWLGGVALFFGVIFFVKYAFEHNLIPPALRIAAGMTTGLALLAGGWWTHRWEKYRVLAQSLCATGTLVLYGVSFAAHAIYQLPLFGDTFTFALMSAVTAAAFMTAIRHDALVVAVLGMLGGFLTPVLLPLVQDQPLALFGYIALLDAGLLALAARGRWTFLASGAATGTILMLIYWTSEFFIPGTYHIGSATLIPMGILLGFGCLFLAAAWWTSRKRGGGFHVPASCFAMLAAAMGFAFYFLQFSSITGRAPLLYGFVLLVNLTAAALALLHPRFSAATLLIAGATFLHLVVWTVESLKPDTLVTALAIYLVFGALHTLWPFTLKRDDTQENPSPDFPGLIASWLPTALIGLMAGTLFVLPDVSMVLWPGIMIANLFAIAACVRNGVVMPVLAALGVTLATAVIWLFHMPATTSAINALLGVALSFSAFFTGAGIWLAGIFAKRGVITSLDPRKLIPLAAGAMPYLLLILMIVQVPQINPSPIFGTGLLLAVLLSAVALLGKSPRLHAVALALCLAMQGAWHVTRFDPAQPQTTLAWHLGFYVFFTALPFVFRKACSASAMPWIASALSGVGHFILVHDLVKRAFPNDMMGLVPAAFAVPALVMLGIEWRKANAMDNLTKSRLAWFGGVELLFITLVFPIQLDRQWLTVAWALEGAALIWLFRHVPHKGLVATGVGLLVTSFVRLSLNPAVISEYERSGTAIINWHLYVYGIVAAAHLIASRLVPSIIDDPSRDFSIRGLLQVLGGILLFLLLNIEIADYFTEPGSTFIAFQFTGNFARDMAYTIGWALFALVTLIIGIATRAKGARFAGIGLLAVTLVKLFLHDLANIENIYRIAALLCTGLIAFLASFLYQRFVPVERDKPAQP